MSEDDLRAIYRYLRSLEPVENDTGPGAAEAEVTDTPHSIGIAALQQTIAHPPSRHPERSAAK
jgi:hypothetical protein